MGSPSGPERLVKPLDVGGRRVLVSVERVDVAGHDEVEVGGRARQTLEHVLDGMSALALQVAERLDPAGASRVKVGFGCDVAVESGSYVALIAKASTSATFTVELEWTNPSGPRP